MSLIDQAGTETLSVTVPTEVAGQLRQAADRRGESLDAYLRRVAEQEAAAAQKIAERVARWEAWAASRPARGVTVDDSREAIYEGCGE